jgi:hypothetical protein
MSSKSAAEVVHLAMNKPPILTSGTITPEILHVFENTCRSFFRNKENIDPKNYIACIAGGLQDPLLADWYWTSQATLDELSFDAFMKELSNKWLANDWEQDVRCKVLGTKQSGSFWEWEVRIRSLNTLLRGSSTHLDDAALLNQLEANLEPWLSRMCDDEHVKEDNLGKWLDAVKIIDERKRRERQQQRADAEEAARMHLKQTGAAAGLSEPSRRINTFHGTPSYKSSSSKPRDGSKSLPKLTDAEQSLLFENDGCLKCRKFFVKHKAADCPNDFPNPATYKTLMTDDVTIACRKTSTTVAAVADTSRNALPVAAVMPPSNISSVLDNDGGDLSKDSDDSVSSLDMPFSIPHYRWPCLTMGRDAPDVRIEVLIDNGSHTVLICHDIASRLGLRCRRLREPMDISLAVSNLNERIVTTLYDWVKLKLHDPNELWASRMVRAVVMPGLCLDVILSLPFLSINKIVIDHDSNTCIVKGTSYNLLNPLHNTQLP